MTITTRLIGRLGGAEVTKIPVSVSDAGVLYAVEIPEGETWLVALHGVLSTGTARTANISIGDTLSSVSSGFTGPVGIAAEATGTATIELSGDRGPSFTGNVYIVPLT